MQFCLFSLEMTKIIESGTALAYLSLENRMLKRIQP